MELIYLNRISVTILKCRLCIKCLKPVLEIDNKHQISVLVVQCGVDIALIMSHEMVTKMFAIILVCTTPNDFLMPAIDPFV